MCLPDVGRARHARGRPPPLRRCEKPETDPRQPTREEPVEIPAGVRLADLPEEKLEALLKDARRRLELALAEEAEDGEAQAG